MAFGQKIVKTAKAVRATGRFCVNPFCMHVAGAAKCRLSCCKIGKKGK